MRRIFNSCERAIIYHKSNGVCQICGIQLKKYFHADHIIPYSKGGLTIIENGQALCKNCNILKSNKMINYQPRQWQIECYERFKEKMFDSPRLTKDFTIHAGVGSGKTMFICNIMHELKNLKYNFVIISPQNSVKKNWSHIAAQFHVNLDAEYDVKYDYKIDYDGISICYAALGNYELLKRRIDKNTIFILDEHHHLSENAKWGNALEIITEISDMVICLTGTPFRSDNKKIPFTRYMNKNIDGIDGYEIIVDYSYTYSKSVKDGICCPTSFVEIDWTVSKKSYDDVEDQRKYLPQILNASHPINNFIDKAIDEGIISLNAVKTYKPKAQGLIVANSQDDADIIYNKLIKKGAKASCIVSDNDISNDTIESFKISDKSWVVAVGMVTEGVDIPNIRVIVYLNNTTTRMFIEQVMGRGVRNCVNYNKLNYDICFFLYPKYQAIKDIKDTIESGYKQFLTEQITTNREYVERIRNKEVMPTLFDNIEAGDKSITIREVNLLPSWNEIVNTLMPINPALANRAQIDYYNAVQKDTQVIDKIEHIPKYKQVDDIKSKIKSKISVLVRRGDFESYEYAHAFFNKAAGIHKQTPLHDVNLLQKKLNHIQNVINNH
jgi:superfamily II DNA or RNA helicase